MVHLQLIYQNQDDSFFMYWSLQYHLKAPKDPVIMFYSKGSYLQSDPSDYKAFWFVSNLHLVAQESRFHRSEDDFSHKNW